MEFLKNKTVKNICINCVFTVVACVVLYLISYFCFGKIEIGTDNLIGILAVLSTILIISSFWLWSYWNLDTVQHEPIQMMIYSFITSFMMQFLLSSMVNQITAYIIPNSVNLILQKYIYNVLLPVCTMYSVFYMYIVHLNAFDEAVDCLIYGGFIGVGIAAASCFESIIGYDTVSLKFLCTSLLNKITLCAAVCALSGMLLKTLYVKKNILFVLVTLLCMVAFYTIEFILEQFIQTNLILAQYTALDIIVPLSFTVCVFIVIVIMIIRVLMKENADEKFMEEKEHHSHLFHILGALCYLLVFGSLIYLECDTNKLKTVSSSDDVFSFSIPVTFQQKSNKTMQKKMMQNREQVYERNDNPKVGRIIMTVDCYADIDEAALNEVTLHNQSQWKVYTPEISDYAKTDSACQYVYILQKDQYKMLFAFLTVNQNDRYIKKIMTDIVKTLKVTETEGAAQ